METSHTIQILKPSNELIAFMTEMQKKKKERMESMRENFMKDHY